MTSITGKTISVFDKTGKPLSPPTGYNLNGQLGGMQGINTTPDGDVWALDSSKSQIVHLPKGDPAQARILCRTVDDKPVDGTCQVKGPFHVAFDLQGRVLVSNANSNTVTRFPANDPGKAEQLEVGYSPHAIAIDSQGNAWVANTLGEPSAKQWVASGTGHTYTALRRADRDMSSRLQDGRPDLSPPNRLRGERDAISDRCCSRPSRQCVGRQQYRPHGRGLPDQDP
ncbi:hypothetical protein [Mesorhizobium sp. L-8-10]|uniref:hypothetical protein n=1 Tax=Mesorhizobium sp. L-8-10 TaxID=2744523 RepID=UPI001929755D|nr:hypothetical protein [Mesorhizobium sp. L-8-10]